MLFLTARDAVTDRLAGFGAGRRRLPDQAVPLRRAGGPAAGAAAPRGRRRRPTVGGLRLDPVAHARLRGREAVADADGVPRAGRAGGAARRVVRRRDLVRAAWPDGAIVHENTLDQYMARLRRKLREVSARESRPPRRRLPAGMRRFRTLRGRLTALGVVAASSRSPSLTVAFNVVLARSLDADANGRCARRPPPRRHHRRSSTAATPRARVARRRGGRSAVWVYEGRARARAAAAPAAAASRRRARRPPASSATSRAPSVRLYAGRSAPAAGARSARWSPAQSLAAYDRTTDLALVGSLALALVLLAAIGVSWLSDRARAGAGARDDAHGGRLERARPGRRFGATSAPTSSASWRARSTRCWTRRGQPAPRAAPVGRAVARAAHAAGPDRGRDGAAPAPRAPPEERARPTRSSHAAPSR